jgi:hypothetical protein
MSDTPFTPYPCSIGEVIDHEDGSYIIRTGDGRTIGIRSATTPSPQNVEHDIANPPVTLATPADIAAFRYGVETGGVAVTVSAGIHRFDTTRENRVMWLAMQGQAQANPGLVQGWKTLDEVFVPLTAADILVIVAAIFAHIAACFAKEAQLLANPPALAALRAANWPA